MSNMQSFGAYAAAFEESLVDDDWSRLEQYFADDASYLPGDGTEGKGRAGAIAALQGSVNALERKCDSREIVGQPEITEDGDRITLKFTIKYGKEGSPGIVADGTEIIDYVDGKIMRMEDIFADPAALFAWRESL